MAEGILKFLHGGSIYVDSVGVRKTEINGFCVTVMDEIGIEMSQHNSKSFDDLENTYFDLVVPMSPDAQHKAVEMTRAMACEVEYWNTFDPSIIESEDRDTMLEAYRTVRDQLMERIKARFPMHRVSDT